MFFRIKITTFSWCAYSKPENVYRDYWFPTLTPPSSATSTLAESVCEDCWSSPLIVEGGGWSNLQAGPNLQIP